MKPSLTLHASWGLAVLGAFAAGSWWSASRTHDNPAVRVSSARTVLDLDGGASNRSPGTNPDSQAPAGDRAVAVQKLLTAEEINALTRDAINDPNPLSRNLAFSRLLESLTPENATLVLESLKTNGASRDQWGLFLYAWGSVDGSAAMAHADTLEGREKDRFLNGVMPGWAVKDPTAAIAWLDGQDDGQAKDRLRAQLVGGLADRDTGLATSYAYQQAQAGNKQAGDYLEMIAGEELRKNGPAAAATWGDSLPDGALKGAALDRIAGTYVNKDPEAAAAWAAKFATTDYGARVIEEVGDEWAERDPKAAVAWLETLNEGAGRSEGSYSALREWTRRDAVAASEYLAAMPQSAAKDSAVSGFARSLAYEDPESAVIWARTITDEGSRIQTLTRAGQAWFRRDPAAATNWLQSASLPESAQQAIVNPPDRRRPRG